MLKPSTCQMPISASVGISSAGLPRKDTGSKPAQVIAALTGPRVGCSRNCQTVAIATSVAVTGRK